MKPEGDDGQRAPLVDSINVLAESSRSETVRNTDQCRDPIYAAFFLGMLVVTFYFASTGAPVIFSDRENNSAHLDWIKDEGLGRVAACLGATICFGAGLCTAWMHATINDPAAVLGASWSIWGGLYTAAMIMSLLNGNLTLTLICGLGLLGVSCFWCAARCAYIANVIFARHNLLIQPVSLSTG